MEETENEERREKRKGHFLKKVLTSVFTGIMFGVFAAGAFLLVIKYAEYKEIVNFNKGSLLEQTVSPSGNSSENERKKPDFSISETSLLTEVAPNTMYIQTDVTEVVENVMPSIVSVTNTYTYNYYYYNTDVDAKGSGIIIGQNDEELLIVTNYHVIKNNNSLSVTFCDNTSAEALVKGTDSNMDLAVIAVKFDDIDEDTQELIKIATIGDSDSLKVGENVIAIGNALGYGQSVTTGVVSAKNREMDMNKDGNVSTFIQTDAAINGGNSGGALLNLAGEVIGINSNKIGGSAVEGMGYAIPISSAKPIIEELMLKETREAVPENEQGCLGITGVTLTSSEASYYGCPEGVYVVTVISGSAASRAGIERGDLIYNFDGENITSMEQLQRLMKYYRKGDEIEVKIYKYEGDEYVSESVTVILGDRADLDN